MTAPVGIGLRAPHVGALLATRPALDFIEVHSENYFGGGAAVASLARVREDYRVSLHGVGLSLGGTDALDEEHLAALAALARRVDPWLVSEHLSWSAAGGRHANELLPMPFTQEAAAHLAARVQHVQERLGREILVENVSAYWRFPGGDFDEPAFVAEVVRRGGCRLLLDVNNVWVNAVNHGFDPRAYLEAIPRDAVAEIHLGGHERRGAMLVDTHGAPVCDEVWSLYADAVARFGARPTLVERDANIPPLDALLAEATRARGLTAAPLRAAAPA